MDVKSFPFSAIQSTSPSYKTRERRRRRKKIKKERERENEERERKRKEKCFKSYFVSKQMSFLTFEKSRKKRRLRMSTLR